MLVSCNTAVLAGNVGKSVQLKHTRFGNDYSNNLSKTIFLLLFMKLGKSKLQLIGKTVC